MHGNQDGPAGFLGSRPSLRKSFCAIPPRVVYFELRALDCVLQLFQWSGNVWRDRSLGVGETIILADEN